jgi:hypothetical protein
VSGEVFGDQAADMKIPSTIDLVLYGLLALAVGGAVGVVVKWKHDAELLKVERAQHTADVQRLEATIAARDERIAIEIENRRLADESSNHFQGRLRELEAQRLADGFGAIRVCRRPVLNLSTAAPGAAAGGSDAAAVPGDPGAAEVSTDVGPAADVYGTRCEANTIQVEELQGWIRGRRVQPPATR